jgi:small GTP-binding protein
MSEDLKCKIVIFGESQVGKTSIIKRYLGYGFDEEVISTYGIENEKKTLEIGDKTVTIIFWDTAGQERFRSIIKAAYKNLDIAIFAFDLTNMETLNAIKDFWFDEVETNSSNSSKGKKNFFFNFF